MSNDVSESGESASPDTGLSVLVSEKRRAVLHTLESAGKKSIRTAELADRVATLLGADDETATDDDYRRRIRTELRHNHLPKRAANGMIVYEKERIQHVPGERREEILSVVEFHEE